MHLLFDCKLVFLIKFYCKYLVVENSYVFLDLFLIREERALRKAEMEANKVSVLILKMEFFLKKIVSVTRLCYLVGSKSDGL